MLIKRAIPSASTIPFVTKEGMPIKIEAQDMQEALLSSMIAAISNLTTVLLKEPLDYTVIQNSTDILLVIQCDEA